MQPESGNTAGITTIFFIKIAFSGGGSGCTLFHADKALNNINFNLVFLRKKRKKIEIHLILLSNVLFLARGESKIEL